VTVVRPAKARARLASRATPRPTWRPGRWSQLAFAAALYVGTAVLVTWPLALHFGSAIYLPPTANWEGGGDLPGSIAHLREFAQGNFPFLPGRVHDFNAPDGLEIRWPLNLATFTSLGLLYLLAKAFGAHVAFNLFVIGGYVASGTAMFLFIRRLIGNPWIALIIGWAFAFYPFAVVKAEHPNFLHGWVFVVVAWRLLELSERPTVRNGLWAGAAGILAASWTHYFLLLAGVFYAALVTADLLLAASRRDVRRRLVPHAVGLGVVLAFVQLMRELLAWSNAPDVGAATEISGIIATSAKPLMYLVPPANTLLGHWTRSFLDDRGLNAVEWTLYLGITMMALAAVGLAAAGLKRLPERLRRVALFAVAAIVAGLIFSAPPQIELFGHTVRTPSYLVFQAAPAYRLYTRFVILVMFGVCVLAALGLTALIRRLDRRAAAGLLAAATVVIPLDLWDKPPHALRELRAPPVYDVLRAQPPGIVAEYPIRSVPQVGHYLDLYYQGTHAHPILNGYYRGPSEERALSVNDLGDPSVPGKLATLGVRYILITPQRLVPEAPHVVKPRRGFELIADDYYATLYRVTAKPIPLVAGWKGFAPIEGPRGARFQWAGDAHAQLEVLADCSPCSGYLLFTTASFAQPRRLEVSVPGVGKLRELTVSTNPTRVAIPLRFDHRVLIDLRASPGPQSIAETIGGGNKDFRKVTVWVGSTRFTELR
jgi:hypothetical protein